MASENNRQSSLCKRPTTMAPGSSRSSPIRKKATIMAVCSPPTRKPPPPAVSNPLADYDVNLPLDYSLHVLNGAKLMNPEIIWDLTFKRGRILMGDKGPLGFGLIIRDGVLVTFNHSRPVRRSQWDEHVVGPRTIAFITGGRVRDCRGLMQTLRSKCLESGKPGASVELTKQLMTQMISGTRFVGLIAGWDDTKDGPVQYLVDGMGGLLKGEKLATGFGFRYLYISLELDLDLCVKGLSNMPMEEILDNPSDAEKYSSWSGWSSREAAEMAMIDITTNACNAPYSGKLASVFCVGRNGVNQVKVNVPVKWVARKYGLLVRLVRTNTRRGLSAGFLDSESDNSDSDDNDDYDEEDK